MKISTILVPIDFSDVTLEVIGHATGLAQALGSRVVLLHISQPDPDFVGYEAGPLAVRSSVAHDFRTEHHQLEEYKRALLEVGVESLALHIQGPHAQKILAEAETQQAGLIVMGSHGHGALYNLLAGSVTAAVLKDARCPVLVVPAPKGGGGATVPLSTTDTAPNALAALSATTTALPPPITTDAPLPTDTVALPAPVLVQPPHAATVPGSTISRTPA